MNSSAISRSPDPLTRGVVLSSRQRMPIAATVRHWLPLALACAAASPQPLRSEPSLEWTHTYHVRAEVRLVFVWAGRDRVGGGRIAFRRTAGSTPLEWSEEVEIIIGSDPERVPGKVNRWGYAQERSDWQLSGGNPVMLRTAFEGVMRHSDAVTPGAVIADHHREAARRVYEYKALYGEISPSGAHAEIRVFHDPRVIHYRAPEPLLARYRQAISRQPAQSRTYFSNVPARYRVPSGFLSGVRGLVARALPICAGRLAAPAQLPSALIVHAAALYRLEVKGVSCLAAWPALPQTGAVADIRLVSLNLARNRRSEFTIAVPVRGSLAGVPLRILYQPNWWLRLRLDIEPPTSHTRG